MDLTTEMFYPGARLDDVVTMVFDKGFRAAVCEATKAIAHQVDTRLEADGSASVTVSRTLPAEVPDFVKKFVGETIELVQSETWAADDGSGVRRADLTLEVVGQPARMTGSIVLEETADGVREVVHGQLKVAVPIFGGKIETELARGIVAAAGAEEKTGRKWLAA
jgi:hypothetical protein